MGTCTKKRIKTYETTRNKHRQHNDINNSDCISKCTNMWKDSKDTEFTTQSNWLRGAKQP